MAASILGNTAEAVESIADVGNGNSVESKSVKTNGVRLNGIRLNSFRLNGIRLNSFRLNGIRLNSFRLNGIRLNSFRLNGVTLNGIDVGDEQFVDSTGDVDQHAVNGVSPWSAMSLDKVSVRLPAAG